MNPLDLFSSQEALFNHVGLEVKEIAQLPLSNCLEMYWKVDEERGCVFYDKEYALMRNNTDLFEYYEDDLYPMPRYYSQTIYRGEEYTLIFCDPHQDGFKWWRVFLTARELPLK